MRAYAVVFALACACAPPPAELPAKYWSAANSVANRSATADFGGFSPLELVRLEGEPLPWLSPPFGSAEVRQGPGPGLSVFPAFAEGEEAAYAIFDLWSALPRPWVQPAWVFVSEFHAPAPMSKRLAGVPNVFPVDVTGSFYSPFWKLRFVTAPEADAETFTDAKAVLDARLPTNDGALVLCPIVPPGLHLAQAEGATAPVHPFTRAPLTRREPNEAWVDGRRVSYFDMGPDRAPYSGDALEEAPAYFFSRPGEGGLVRSSLPAVLPPRSWTRSLVRRVDVELPGTAAVFVPADLPALAEGLRAEGFTVPAADAAIATDVARRYQLRVATDASCFGDATRFPAGCAWLDSEAAVLALSPWRRHESPTLLAIGVLLAEGAVR